MKKIIAPVIAALLLLPNQSCKQKTVAENNIVPVVSVSAEPVVQSNIEKLISFSGKSIYIKKNIVVSPIAGYIIKAEARFGEVVEKNKILFEIQTKEGKALENEGSLSSAIGTLKVTAPSGGIINEVAINETGGFVSEGGSLCTIVDNEDIMVQLNVPFEYNSLIRSVKSCKIILPDNLVLDGTVYKVLQVVDETNQTQSVLIKPHLKRQLPENLNVTIQFIQDTHLNTSLVSRNSLMANETQNEFWVMKIINDSIAVKIPVTKGFENDTMSEVFSPFLNKNDLVISIGAYGLPDSSVVKIEK